MLLPTALVGSYPQPDWLIDRAKLSKQVPRVRAHDLWRVDPQQLDAAQDDATLLAIRDQERAGLDVITRAGGVVMTDTCSAFAQAIPPGTRVAALDSAKQAHYLPSIMNIQAWFGSTKDCINAAVTGKWNPERL